MLTIATIIVSGDADEVALAYENIHPTLMACMPNAKVITAPRPKPQAPVTPKTDTNVLYCGKVGGYKRRVWFGIGWPNPPQYVDVSIDGTLLKIAYAPRGTRSRGPGKVTNKKGVRRLMRTLKDYGISHIFKNRNYVMCRTSAKDIVDKVFPWLGRDEVTRFMVTQQTRDKVLVDLSQDLTL